MAETKTLVRPDLVLLLLLLVHPRGTKTCALLLHAPPLQSSSALDQDWHFASWVVRLAPAMNGSEIMKDIKQIPGHSLADPSKKQADNLNYTREGSNSTNNNVVGRRGAERISKIAKIEMINVSKREAYGAVLSTSYHLQLVHSPLGMFSVGMQMLNI